MIKHFVVLVDVNKPVSSAKLQAAIARVIEWTLDSDIENAEILNRDVIGQIQVLTCQK